MRFVNGRLFDDCNKGSFTFASRNGTSTIDYVLARESHLTLITDFAVLNFNQWSDHAPLHFAVKCNNNLLSKHEYVETKNRWSARI
jgi:endonuclease/exonuclease/phosphatase family metal-dependent hydrolase